MPSSPPISSHVVQSELFVGLDDTALRQILDTAKVRHIGPKKDVTVIGEQPGHLFLLQAGQARFYKLMASGSELVMGWVAPGGIVGLVSLLENPPAYLASAAAVSECEFLVWDHSTIRRLVKAYPQLRQNSLRLALQHLQIYMDHHASIMANSPESRLAQALGRLATRVGDVQPSGVKIDITNEKLGSLSDISTFTASRLLAKWEKDGRLSKQRGGVTLYAPESLMTT